MEKTRLLILLTTVFFVSVVGYFVALVARGYDFDIENLSFKENGILVAKSDPDGASIYIDSKLAGATNSNIKLAPGNYNVEIKKDGYTTWSKSLTIKKEEVTQVTAQLFRNAPSLSPITFNGAQKPVVSEDLNKVAYINSEGLWILSVTSLPIGFTNDPKRITDNLTQNSTFYFSPDGRQIMVEDLKNVYLLDTNEFVASNQRQNVANQKEKILIQWQEERDKKQKGELQNLPQELQTVFKQNVESFKFSPDQTMVLYKASSEATIKEDLIAKLPGSSTQQEERTIKKGSSYIYDLKEDKNFFISNSSNDGLYWLPTSRHIIESKEGKIIIMDYDGTNRQTVFSGNYIKPHAYPHINASKILILTSLGSGDENTNIYSMSIK